LIIKGLFVRERWSSSGGDRQEKKMVDMRFVNHIIL
jgi:hypothetical protein